MTKESTVKKIRLLQKFYKDIFKNTIIFFLIGSLIIVILKTTRFNFFAYFICFFVSFGISTILCFMHKEKRIEFMENEV